MVSLACNVSNDIRVSRLNRKNNTESTYAPKVSGQIGHRKALYRWENSYDHKGLYLIESFLLNWMVVSPTPDRYIGKWSLDTAGGGGRGPYSYICI